MSRYNRYSVSSMADYKFIPKRYQFNTVISLHTGITPTAIQLCNSDTRGEYRLNLRLVLWTPPPPCTPLLQNTGENTAAIVYVLQVSILVMNVLDWTETSGIPFKFLCLIWFPIVRMQGLVINFHINSNICPNTYDNCTDSSMPPPRTTVYYTLQIADV